MAEESQDEYLESWEELTRAELVEECKARGLVVTGSKPALIERLERHESEAPPAEEAASEEEPELPFGEGRNPYDPPESAEDAVDGPEVVEEGQEDPDPEKDPEEPAEKPSGPSEPPEQAPVPSGNMHHVEFDLPDGYELLHEDLDHGWKLRARDEAIAAGHQPIGGAYAAHHVRFGSRDGKPTIIYRVPIRTGER